MPISRTTLYMVRFVTFLMAVVAASSMIGWGLKLSQSSPTPSFEQVVSFPQTMPHTIGTEDGSFAGLLDGVAVPHGAVSAQSSSSYKVLGVVSNGRDAGYAVMTVDGKAARPYWIGAKLDEATTVVAVSGVGVEVQHQSGERVLLKVPALSLP